LIQPHVMADDLGGDPMEKSQLHVNMGMIFGLCGSGESNE
jgi:hypothetical protein